MTRFPVLEDLNQTGAAGEVPPSVETVVSAPQHFYVLPAGNDSKAGTAWDRAVATLSQAVALAKSVGGGHIHMGAGTWTLSSTVVSSKPNWAIFVDFSNLTVEGIPGLTKIVGPGSTALSGYRLLLADTPVDGQTISNVHFSGIIFDASSVPANGGQTGGLTLGSIVGATVDRCQSLGGGYPLQLGASTLPLQQTTITRSLISNATIDLAIINADTLDFSDNIVTNCVFDLEPNFPADSLRAITIARNKFFGTQITTGGSSSDPNRHRGIQIIDNQFVDSPGIGWKSYAAPIVRGNVFRYTIPYPNSSIPGTAIYLQQGADDALVEDNLIENMVSGSNPSSAINLQDVSRCVVRGNKIRDTNNPPITQFAVQELQVNPGIVSGFTVTPGTGMQVKVSPGVMQQASAGTLVPKTLQTLSITAAGASDRIDMVYLDGTTGVAAVINGSAASFGMRPAPPTVTWGTQVRVAFVYVHASESSVAAADVTDARIFVPSDNEIDQQPVYPASLSGTVGLLATSSSRRTKGPQLSVGAFLPRERAYIAAVLADAPLVYYPMLEQAGVVAYDLGVNNDPATYLGGVELAQTISAGVFGPSFDGNAGQLLVARPLALVRSALSLNPFTLEAQILPTSLFNGAMIWQQGPGTNAGDDIKWFINGTGKLALRWGGAFPATTVSPSITVLNHVAVSWDGTSMIFYLNGVADPGGTLTPGAFTPTAGLLYPLLCGTFFPGVVRHAAIYQSCLSGARIAAHAAAM